MNYSEYPFDEARKDFSGVKQYIWFIMAYGLFVYCHSVLSPVKLVNEKKNVVYNFFNEYATLSPSVLRDRRNSLMVS